MTCLSKQVKSVVLTCRKQKNFSWLLHQEEDRKDRKDSKDRKDKKDRKERK